MLGDDADDEGTPYLNHTLHEFGHALGLSHEHARIDENAQCVPATHDEYHIALGGFITPYDKNSVMHYWWPSAVIPNCQSTGTNYSHAGLTGWDKLALHIMYPEDVRVAEIAGSTLLRAGQPLQLSSTWVLQGATGFATSDWQWYVGGVLRSTATSLYVGGLTPGTYALTVSHKDFLGRSYSYSGLVRVLTDDGYWQLMASTAAAQAALAPLITMVYAPVILSP